MKQIVTDWREFLSAYSRFFSSKGKIFFQQLEQGKKLIASLLYRQRGRFAQPFSHLWLGVLLLLGILLSPVIEEKLRGEAMSWQEAGMQTEVLGGVRYLSAATFVSGEARGEVVEYVVKEGDTVSSIAKKFDLTVDTIIWANDLKSAKTIKVGQRLKIPPVSGIVHSVRRGETVYSIAKKYRVDPQNIVDFPFNTFSNDETFALQIGQVLIVPEGIMPEATPAPALPAPMVAVGSVGKGLFIWPTSGKITQRYVWYHPAIDIANKDAPVVVAAPAGKVNNVIFGRYGYGNQLILDHGDGYQTLYAHLNSIYVEVGQTVSQGQAVGQMGSTGRSTGIHLHFEVIKNGAKLNPLNVLQ